MTKAAAKTSEDRQNEDQLKYSEKIKPYMAAIHSTLEQEKNELLPINKGDSGAAIKRLTLAEEMLNLTANYITLSDISLSMLKERNEVFLNEGRKSFNKAVIYLEEVVSPLVDAPFSEYAERLSKIGTVDAQKRYTLIKKTGLALELLKNAHGDNIKWRWTFVEMEGRFAAAAKNIINLKTVAANKNPDSFDYEPTMFHLKLVKKLLLRAAERYNEKYESPGSRIDDLKTAIQFLNALRRIHSHLGERENAEALKKKADSWAVKLEMDMQKKEKAALKRK